MPGADVQKLTQDQFVRELAAFDRDVARTPGIDRFCSSSDWIVPADEGLMPGRRSVIARGEYGWLALKLARREQWRCLEPFEAMWGLSCPAIGQHPERLAAELAGFVTASAHAGEWQALLLTGLPPDSALAAALARSLSARFVLRPSGVTRRCVADLSAGLDGYLAARSSNFRKSLKKSRRAADRAGVVFERAHAADADAADAIYERILAVERRSWKGRAGVGIDRGRMCAFYRAMVPRLAARGALRVVFARAEVDGAARDVAYVLGGTLGDTYRGLQFSYDLGLESLGLGNLCQLREITDLCADGIARYDLGTDMPYKRRWAEQICETVSLVAFAR